MFRTLIKVSNNTPNFVFNKTIKTTPSPMSYQTIEKGTLHSLDYRIFIRGPNGQLVSPWHDIPLYANESEKIFNMVVEIPRWSNAKMEMATKEPMAPIKQDEKKGLPRFVNNIFPHKGYIWNYGALPQTWEDPNHQDEGTGAKGDNDPIDIVEIGTKVHPRGSVIKVKVLGTLALLDEGETDWKLIGIDVYDEMAPKLNSIEDVEREMPGLLTATHEWLRVYKIPTGKPANVFAFNGQYKDVKFAHNIIEQTHTFWKALIASPNPPLNTESNVAGAQCPADAAKWENIVAQKPAPGDPCPIPVEVDKWHYIK